MKILVLNGPNINLLGIREPNVYGKSTYQDLKDMLEVISIEKKIIIDEKQSNHEGVLVDMIQDAYEKYDAIVINPAAYTHTSIAILDALKAVGLKTVEVHISDVSKREDYRQISYVSEYASKTISGKGLVGYKEAIEFIINEM